MADKTFLDMVNDALLGRVIPPVFPVDLVSPQTLTNKTLTAPTITSPLVTSAPVTVSATTLTLSPALHAGKTVLINSLTGCTVTLPAATGSGVVYCIRRSVLATSGSDVFKVANASDYMRGFAYTTQDAGGAGISFGSANTATLATESDTVTWNRSTTGLCDIGDSIWFTDMLANVWAVEAEYSSNGSEATPFSAGV